MVARPDTSARLLLLLPEAAAPCALMRTLTGKMICSFVFAALADVVSRREALVLVDDQQDDETRGTGEDLVAEFESRAAKSA